MILRCQSNLGVLLTAIFLSGCASFQPALRYTDLLRPRTPTVSAVKEELTISVEEFASPNKSIQAFDANLVAQGILPLLVRIENNSATAYRIRQVDINASLNGESMLAVYSDQAADQAATSEYAAKALGWTVASGPLFVVFWPVTIAASAAHTSGVNNRIRQHFANMEFTDKLLKPKQSFAGFVYFKLPAGVKKLENMIVSVEPREEESGSRVDFKLSLPTLDLEAPSSTITAGGS